MSLMDTIKAVANITKQIGDIELNAKNIELQSEVFSLLEENRDLKQKIEELQEIESIENNLKLKGHFYYRELENREDGPFCTSCGAIIKN